MIDKNSAARLGGNHTNPWPLKRNYPVLPSAPPTTGRNPPPLPTPGTLTVRGRKFDGESFLKSPYTSGYFIAVDGGEYVILTVETS